NLRQEIGGTACRYGPRPHRSRAVTTSLQFLLRRSRPRNQSETTVGCRQRARDGGRPSMSCPVDLVLNAIVAGLLLGGFYAAVTSGISISFGILDIVNIAHPAFIILGSYIAYIVNTHFGLDPILIAIIVLPAFYALGAAIYEVYYQAFEKRGQEALRGLAFFFGLLFVTEVVLIMVFGVDYRYVQAFYIDKTLRLGFVDLPFRMLGPCVGALLMLALLQLFLS